ncbi:hypothetical protein QAD02_008854 [Eretmocerus hayati]|uniref:Uncharacterized protein n=1 Tax=Eretmocerus hayati TaxID=131215 RepID=A0ACC2N817_9HYME|nr:hypothetical protein QAD02_008854 [Eretmocerus hayati]
MAGVKNARKRIITLDDNSSESGEDTRVFDRGDGDEIPQEILDAAEEATHSLQGQRPYSNELSKEYAPSTLYNKHSILKTVIQRKEDVNIGDYHKLNKLLKANKVGFEPTKAAALTTEEIKYLMTNYLFEKVVAMDAVSGALRRHELVDMAPGHIRDAAARRDSFGCPSSQDQDAHPASLHHK